MTNFLGVACDRGFKVTIPLPRKLFLLMAGFGIIRSWTRSGKEQLLVRALKRGDAGAFDELVKIHSEALRRFISRRVQPADRDDVLQDTWLAVWESARSFDGDSLFRTWVFSVCFHKIQDYWRREQCRPPSQAIVDAEGKAAHIPAEFARIELRESMRAVWEACTPDQRELLRMYYSDGLKLREISQVLNRNLNTVKYQFYRAHEVAAESLPASDVMEVPSKAVAI